MRCKRGARERQPDHSLRRRRQRHLHVEGGSIRDEIRVCDELRFQGAVDGIQVGGGDGLDSKLGGELPDEGVVDVAVAAGDENAAVREEVGGGVIHPGDGGRRLDLEGPGGGVVEDRVESGVGGRVVPSLCAVLSAVDDQDLEQERQRMKVKFSEIAIGR